jgi:hypothetical protein
LVLAEALGVSTDEFKSDEPASDDDSESGPDDKPRRGGKK